MMRQQRNYLLASVGNLNTANSAIFWAILGGLIQTVSAQETGAVGGLRPRVFILPRVSATEILTDNVALASTARQSEQITEISPGIRVSSDAGRAKAFLDYSMIGRAYAQNSSGATFQNALNTFGTVEAVNKWAFLDFSGNISQQSISAVGTQSGSNANLNSNQTESSTYKLSPYIRGKLGTAVDYDARFAVTSSRSQSSLVSDVVTRDSLVRLSGKGPGGRVGWSLDAGNQKIVYIAGRATESASLTGQLSYAIAPKLNLSVTAGQESNNYTSVDSQVYATYGAGISWVPSERTTISASRQVHSFGEAHSLSFEHRTARTAWKISDSQSVSATPSLPGIASLGSAYDLYFAQFASIEPDPILRAALVNNFLLSNGINPNTTIVGGLLTSAVSLQRRQDFTVALLGARDTVTFLATRSENSRLDSITTSVDDLSKLGMVQQNGLSISYAHRLTPSAAVNVLVSGQQSSGSIGSPNTTLRSVNLSLSSTLGRRTTAVLSARRVVFDSATTPYTESALVCTLNVQF